MVERTLQRVLHVEDEADIRAVAKMALEEIGAFDVRSCASGPEALAQAPGFAPDLILIDVMMPGMDGPTTMRALRQLKVAAETPIVFMTAKAQPREIDELLSFGATDVIVKPFDPMTLAERVQAAWRKHVAG